MNLDSVEYPKIPFKEFQQKPEYKRLVKESKERFPDIDDISIVMMINLWYNTEVLLLPVDDVEKELEKSPCKGEMKRIGVYTPEEYKEAYPAFSEPLNVLEKV